MSVAESTSFLIREPAEVYHAKAKEHLTSHDLGDFRRCPLLYRKKKLGLIADEDRPAYLIGRALHTLVLEGRDRFEAEYAVGGPINPKTGEIFGPTTKAFAEWAAAQGKPVLTVAQFDLVENMADGVRANGIAARPALRRHRRRRRASRVPRHALPDPHGLVRPAPRHRGPEDLR